MKEKLLSLMLEIIEEHPRTFELFAFTLLFLFIQVCIECMGVSSVKTDCILIAGGGMTALAIGLGAFNDNAW